VDSVVVRCGCGLVCLSVLVICFSMKACEAFVVLPASTCRWGALS
jgi:hypothetical protein